VTERKAFKKVVRARMAHTGESYSTAHRQVSAHAPSAAPRHRESALTRRLLAAAGVTVSEPMACGLGGGIGFMYAVFEYSGVPHPLLTIVAQHHPDPWTPAVLDRLGVPCTEQHSSSTPAALNKLRKAVVDGSPALCTVDRTALPWRSDNTFMAGADPHPVLVVGIDGDTVTVDDADGSDHQLDAAEFGRAWAGHRKGRHHLLTAGDPPSTVELERAVPVALRATVGHLTGPVLGNSFDVNFGFSGMAKLVDELRKPRGWERRFATPMGYDHALNRLEACLQREYTAADATRPLYADFLAEAAPLVPGRDLAGAAALSRESAAGWREVSRIRALGLPPRETFDRLADLIDGCLATERHLVELLTG